MSFWTSPAARVPKGVRLVQFTNRVAMFLRMILGRTWLVLLLVVDGLFKGRGDLLRRRDTVVDFCE